jgi:hypothetical protein
MTLVNKLADPNSGITLANLQALIGAGATDLTAPVYTMGGGEGGEGGGEGGDGGGSSGGRASSISNPRRPTDEILAKYLPRGGRTVPDHKRLMAEIGRAVKLARR